MGLLSTIGAASGRAFGLTRVGAAIRDAYFNLTTLLLPGNGTNGAQNNTFLDSSSNNFTITRNGNTTQGTFSPFSQTGWSVNLDGTGDYLTVADNAVLDMGSSNFTMEFWTYITGTLGTYQALVSKRATTGTYGGISLYVTSSRTLNLQATLNGSTWGVDITTTSTVNLNEWAHIAVVRNGNVWTVYINGTSGGTTTVAGTVPDNASAFTIGAGAADGGHNMVASYISNFRLVKGTALYTANFTPSTSALTTTSQGATATEVELLTCQGNRFVDISDNAFTITVNGNPSVQAFSPFAPTAAYDAATVGGSGYFDGTGDYLASATSTDLQLGSSDFSVEWWEYRTVLSNVDTAIVCGDGTFNAQLAYYNTGFPRFYLSTTGSSWNVFSDAATGAIAANSWNHFVLTRSGTAFRVFLNGVLSIYATGSGSVTQSTNQIFISGGVNGNSAPIEGYMSGVRFVKGSIPTSYQTSSTTTNTSIFTPPTAPVTTTSQGATSGDVKYLVNFTNAGITDATAKNDLETVGNAQISTTQSKFGGSSMSFDGNGDYLFSPQSNNPPNLNVELVRGDFTIEFWFRANTVAPTIQGLIVKFDGDATARTDIQYMINLGGSSLNCNAYQGNANNDITFTSAISANTWYHVAFVRSGNSFYAYLDGARNATIRTITGDLNSGTNWPLYIGTYVEGGTGYQFNGFIDDLRITKFARYSGATITVPTAAFPLQ